MTCFVFVVVVVVFSMGAGEIFQGEGSRGRGGGKQGARWREAGVGDPPVHPYSKTRHVSCRDFVAMKVA